MITGLHNPSIGVVSTPAFLLDLTSHVPARAYSTRRLSSAYIGPLIRVRRSSDNAEQDIYASGLEVDTVALTTFVGANDGFVTKMYDQSGNSQDATQTTTGDQKSIVVGGVIQLMGSKPSILGTGGDYMDFPIVSDIRTIMSVFSPTSFTPYNSFFGNSTITPFHGHAVGNRLLRSASSDPNAYNGSWRVNGGTPAILDYIVNTGVTHVVSCVTLANVALDQWAKDRTFSDRTLKGHASEFIVWSVDAGSDILRLEQNQLIYWGV